MAEGHYTEHRAGGASCRFVLDLDQELPPFDSDLCTRYLESSPLLNRNNLVP